MTYSRAFAIAVPITAVLLLVGWISDRNSNSKADKATVTYCASVQAGHTTALNTETVLGTPDQKTIHTVAGLPSLFLRYGDKTLGYSWTGELDSSLYVTGC